MNNDEYKLKMMLNVVIQMVLKVLLHYLLIKKRKLLFFFLNIFNYLSAQMTNYLIIPDPRGNLSR